MNTTRHIKEFISGTPFDFDYSGSRNIPKHDPSLPAPGNTSRAIPEIDGPARDNKGSGTMTEGQPIEPEMALGGKGKRRGGARNGDREAYGDS
jgi:hypothetical protein